MKFLRLAVPLALLVFAGAGTSAAAEGALPGSPLYAMKVGVNEKVVAAFAFSADAKTELAAQIAGRRLAEANALAAQGQLDVEAAAELRASFEDSAERAESRIEALRASGNVDAAERISSRFAAALQAHERALEVIAMNRGNAKVAVATLQGPQVEDNSSANVTMQMKAQSDDSVSLEDDMIEDPILEIRAPLRAALRAISKDHGEAQAELSAGAEAATEVAVTRRIAAAKELIAEVRETLKRSEGRLSAEVSARAKAELDAAAKAAAEAEAKASARAYRDALALANRAAQAAQEVKVLLKLQLQIGVRAESKQGAPISALNPERDINLFGDASVDSNTAVSSDGNVPVPADRTEDGDDDGAESGANAGEGQSGSVGSSVRGMLGL